MAIRGYVFDAYGTLFDVHAVVEAGRAITTDPAALSAAWRQKQLEYTWLRALMGRYEDFWAVTAAALRHAVRRLGLTASEAELARLMDAYLSLACFPEVRAALARLAGRPRAILSNGAPRMLAGGGPRGGGRPPPRPPPPAAAGRPSGGPARARCTRRGRPTAASCSASSSSRTSS